MAGSVYQWLMFTGALVLAMSLPGPGVLATVGHSVRLGFTRTLPFIFGAALGDVTFLWIALTGISQLIQSRTLAFHGLSLIAGLYFLWLGRQMLRRTADKGAARTGTNKAGTDKTGTDKTGAGKSAAALDSAGAVFAGGYILTVSNPKVVLFYAGLLPSLLTVQHFSTGDYVFVSVLTPVALICVLSGYAYAAGVSRHRLGSGPYFRRLQLLAAVLFFCVAGLLCSRTFFAML